MRLMDELSFGQPKVKRKKKKSKSLVKDQKRLAYKLMTMNFDLVAKQIEVGSQLGVDMILYRDPDDEFFASRAAIEVLTGAEPDTPLFEHLDELISSRFMDIYCVTRAENFMLTFRTLASEFSDYLEEVGVRVKSPWEQQGKREFLEVTFEYFPDGGCDFFRRIYQGSFDKEVMA